MHAYFQFANKSKQPSCKRRSALFCILPGNRFRPGGANRRAGVQLILVQGSSPPRIVLLWDPRGAGEGVCGPRGGAFTNTAAAENLNCKGGKNRVAWMADILGWHNDQVGRKIPRRELRCNCIIGTGSHHFSNRAAKLTQGQVFEKLKKRKIGIKFLKLSLSSYLFCWKTWFPRMQDIF